MTIPALSAATTGATVTRLTPARAAGFAAQLPIAVGQGSTAHGHGTHGHTTQETGAQDNRTKETGTVSAPSGSAPVHTLADDTRALAGDVFGALGADTPTAATAQRAIAAYRRAG